jgi:hypothetical protein
MTKITFSLSLQTSATCSDMAAGSALYTAMQKAGGTLAGNVSQEAVEIECAAGARRLLGGASRRLQASLDLTFAVTIPSSEAAASQTALANLDLATATAAFETAAAEAGGSFTFTVTEDALTALKASVVTEELPFAGANLSSSTTAAPDAAGESSGTMEKKVVAPCLLAAIFLAMGSL